VKDRYHSDEVRLPVEKVKCHKGSWCCRYYCCLIFLACSWGSKSKALVVHYWAIVIRCICSCCGYTWHINSIKVVFATLPHVEVSIFPLNTSTNRSLSGLFCSWLRPIMCPISCTTWPKPHPFGSKLIVCITTLEERDPWYPTSEKQASSLWISSAVSWVRNGLPFASVTVLPFASLRVSGATNRIPVVCSHWNNYATF